MEIINWNELFIPYEQTVDELIAKFKGIGKQFKKLNQHSPIENVEGRVKTKSSILEKTNKKNISLDEITDKIEDIAGIRIICRFVEDIDKVISLIRDRDGFDIKILEERDYITNTKPSGYRSYHILIKYPLIMCTGPITIKAEIQIRTIAMNFWATIEHSLRYKYNGNMPEELKNRLISSAEASFQLDKEMDFIRGEILEAQKITKIKNDTVDDILDVIQKLHNDVKLDNINELNKAFIELYQEDNLDKLLEFKQQIRVMANLYKLE